MKRAFLLLLVAFAVAGCAGGGGSAGPVSDGKFRINWPERSRAALTNPLTSALSARVLLVGAASGVENVTVDVNRDPARSEAYQDTYAIPATIATPTSISATFYATANQGGDIVGTATGTSHFDGNILEFDAISVTGTIAQVIAADVVLAAYSGPQQLTFTARSDAGDSIAVTPGSARWTLISGPSMGYLQPDGTYTPLNVGRARAQVTVDGVTSQPVNIDVVEAPVPVYSWSDGKGGYMGNPGFSAVEGNFFQVSGGVDIIVTKLGYEADRPTNPGGITAIFNESGAILAQANISSSDELQSGYYYKTIEPLRLSAGARYYVGSLHGTGAGGSCRSETNLAVYPQFITDLGTWYKISNTIGGGTWFQSGTRHYVGNFQAYQLVR